jgi:hypothetical protein
MRRSRRFALAAVLALFAIGIVGATALGASGNGHTKSHGHGKGGGAGGFPPSVRHFNLDGYKIETNYTLGRNTGNTFDQTYGTDMVQGVPVKGPAVGMTFPPVDYVAMPVGHKMLYVAWLDPSTHAIVDAFVMNFRTHVVFDYAPDSHPESSGTVKILERGSHRIK